MPQRVAFVDCVESAAVGTGLEKGDGVSITDNTGKCDGVSYSITQGNALNLISKPDGNKNRRIVK